MKKQLLALGTIATLFFACSGGGGGDVFVGRWVGNMGTTSDTFSVAKNGANYDLTHQGSKMTGTASGDTLTISMGGGNVKFGYNKTTKQLSIAMGPNTYNYDKK